MLRKIGRHDLYYHMYLLFNELQLFNNFKEKQMKSGSDTSARNMIDDKENHDSLAQDGMEMEILIQRF